MKKIILVSSLFALAIFLAAALTVEAAPRTITADEADMIAGFDRPTYGWARVNDNNEITGYRGVNYFLGYSEKRYLNPLKIDDLNFFWGFGTQALVLPYIGGGVDFTLGQRDDGSFFSIGGGIHLSATRVYSIARGNISPLTFLPSISLSYRF